jgi:hypothetical protein
MSSSLPRAAALVLSLAALLAGPEREVARAAGPLPHAAYVWQRAWGERVEEAVRAQAPEFARVVVLGAEITWHADGSEVVHTDAVLDAARSASPPGIALRIGPWPGPFDVDGAATRCVLATARRLLDAAHTRGVAPSELQIDFDCATSRLAGFRTWIETVRRAAAPTPVTFTALPAWLCSDAFPALAASADGYVLQVHSLERPSGPDAVAPLCDARRARRWIEQAARFGVPFRVALPTYGYEVAFRADGTFAGVVAEGEPRAWPAGTRTVVVAADAAALAELVRIWSADRPAALTGLLWYRLPVPGDRHNWTAEALRRVRRGEVPRAAVFAEVHRPDARLAEVRLGNRGPADGAGPEALDVRWTGARLVATDALAGFRAVRTDAGGVRLQRSGARDVAAGSDRMVAWLRFDGAAEVSVRAVP